MENNKIILIHVGNFYEGKTRHKLSPPLGIIYLGSYLVSHGYNIKLMDVRLKNKNEFFSELQQELPNAILVGLSVTSPLIKEALIINKFIKTVSPSVNIVWGGFHATLFPESTLRNDYIDFVISGEGEIGLLGLVEYLLERRSISSIPNLIFKNGDAITKNRAESGEKLENIGIPCYDLLDFSHYIQEDLFVDKMKIDMLTSRGCHARCAFCVNSIIQRSKWRAEPIPQTLRNLDTLQERYKIENIYFIDEDFFCDLDRVKNLAPELAKRGITWNASCRADYIRDGFINDSVLKMLYGCGCRGLRFGLESGSQRILDLLNKGITVEQSLYAIKKAVRYRIGADVSFMMGIPDETLSDVLLTFDLILKIIKITPIMSIIGPQMFRPYPGSVLFDRCVKKGLRIPSSMNEWSNFFMQDFPVYNKENYPWLSELNIFRKANLCRAYLDKHFLPLWLRCAIVKFHLRTRLRFIETDYRVYKFLRRIFKFTKDTL
jgi:radical SAM superfamily enzyme YgiQ (UPF0313 family)